MRLVSARCSSCVLDGRLSVLDVPVNERRAALLFGDGGGEGSFVVWLACVMGELSELCFFRVMSPGRERRFLRLRVGVGGGLGEREVVAEGVFDCSAASVSVSRLSLWAEAVCLVFALELSGLISLG